MKLLDGKIAFVTGAGNGIGRATSLAMAAEGAWVAVTDLSLQGAMETVSQIVAAGGQAEAMMLDVADKEAVDACVDGIVAQRGRLDCAFNNAGIFAEELDTDWASLETYDRSVAVNQRGVLLCMAAELRHMLAGGKGAIVNTASIAGIVGMMSAGYCGSKHAVVGFTRSAALRYAPNNIRINAVCPGVILTSINDQLYETPNGKEVMDAMSPMRRIGQAREIADAVVFLCSDKASFITGHPLAVDGGFLAQ